MARLQTSQVNFTSGELDPLLAAREDIRFYYSGLERARNVFVIPQGPVLRRWGLEFLGELEQPLDGVTVTAGMVTAPQGGVAADLVDPEDVFATTGPIGTADPYIVAQVDFGVATMVRFVDCVDLRLTEGASDSEFRIQHSDDAAAWTNFGTTLRVRDAVRSRRRGPTGGPASSVSARYWRLVRVGATDLGAAVVELGALNFFQSNGGLSAGRLVPFKYDSAEQYLLIMTDGNIAVMRGGLIVGNVCAPHQSAQLGAVTWTQSLDTLLLFHQAVHPWRVFRQGDDDEWDFRNQPFKRIPQHDYGDSPGGEDEVQRIDFLSEAAGDKFEFSLGSERTTSYEHTNDTAVNAASIQSLLRALPSTSEDGITVSVDGDNYLVTFGGDDGKTDWPPLVVATVKGDGAAVVGTETKGEPPGEDVFSQTRGFPRCGVFYQQRLFMGGIPPLPNVLLGSITGFGTNGEFDFDTNSTDEDRGIFVALDADGNDPILHLFAGQHLQIFTGSSEFYVSAQSLAPLDIAAILTTREGSLEGVRPQEADGATLFLQRGGKALREFIFEDVRQRYEAEPISLLSSHLLSAPVSTAMRTATSTDESDLMTLVNDDGTAALLVTLRAQNITGFVQASTDGAFLEAGGVDLGTTYFVVEREIDGTARRFIERFSADRYLDSSIVIEPGAATDTFAVPHLEGKTLWAMVDGSPLEQVTVTAGSVVLSRPVETRVELGLNHIPLIRDLPVRGDERANLRLSSRKRVVTVELSLFQTGSIELAANGGASFPVALRTLGPDLLDVPMEERLFTGDKLVEGLVGYDEGGQVEITQTIPGPMMIRSIRKEVEV